MKAIVILVIVMALATCVSADIISVNAGGDKNLAITPGGPIEDFFTGLVPFSPGAGGGGSTSYGRTELPGFSITVIPKNSQVVQENTIPVDIIFTNERSEDSDVSIKYYFARTVPMLGGFVTQTASEEIEQAKKLPVGTYKITRNMLAPPGEGNDGNWSIVVDYKSSSREVQTATGIQVVQSIWPKVQYFLIFIILFLILTWYLLIYKRRRKDEDDDKKRREKDE